jgi:hypothetical protein
MRPKNTLPSCRRWLAALLLGVVGTTVSAASLPRAGKILSGSIAESHADSTVTVSTGGESTTNVVTKSTTTVKLTIALGDFDGFDFIPLDLSTVTGNTRFTVSVGEGEDDEFSFSGRLRDDPNYTVGKRSAFFPVNLNEATQKPIGSNGLKLSWTATKLTVAIVRARSDQNDKGLNQEPQPPPP